MTHGGASLFQGHLLRSVAMSEFNTADDASPNDSSPGNSPAVGQRPIWEWVPVVWQIAHRRLVQSQVRLLGLSLLVGLVAGLAAVVF